jgi:hypothetical protein
MGELPPGAAVALKAAEEACGPVTLTEISDRRGSAFTGTMVHLTAPELAARIVADQQPVLTTRPADVYALAGTLWTCVTGDWPLDYPAAGIDRRALGPADLLTAVAGRSAPLTATIRWPETQAVLRPVLLAAADDRPAADELADLIGALSG